MADELAENKLIGHKKVLEYFAQLGAERWPATALFVGPTGVGKNSVATFIAAQLVGCEATAAEQHPQIIRLRPGLNEKTGTRRATIPVEAVRELRPVLALQHTSALVIIIEQAELLSAETGNALLKIIEEPNKKLFFMILAQSEDGVLETIRSRSALFRCAPVAEAELRDALVARGFESEKIDFVLPVAEGRPGRALRFLNDPEEYDRLGREYLRFNSLRSSRTLLASEKILADFFGKKEAYIETRAELREVLHFWLVWLRQESPMHPALEFIVSTIQQLSENMHPRLLIERIVIALGS